MSLRNKKTKTTSLKKQSTRARTNQKGFINLFNKKKKKRGKKIKFGSKYSPKVKAIALVFVVMFASIGAYYVYKSFAATPGSKTYSDFNGDGKSDVLWFAPGKAQDYIWYGTGTKGKFSSVEVTSNGKYKPVIGDFNGDGNGDILWYAAGSAQDYIWYGTNKKGKFSSIKTKVTPKFRPVAGDFDGDGKSDIIWYAPGSAQDYVWYGTARKGKFKSVKTSVNGTFSPMSGDFNGDRKDDVMWYAPGSAQDYVWYGTSKRAKFGSFAVTISGKYRATTGDFNGDRKSDIMWHAPGKAQDYIWYGTSRKGKFSSIKTTANGSYTPIPGDFDGDGKGDMLWYAKGKAQDYVWYGTSKHGKFKSVEATINSNYAPSSSSAKASDTKPKSNKPAKKTSAATGDCKGVTYQSTDEAIRACQGQIGATVDGIWGPKTEKAYKDTFNQPSAYSASPGNSGGNGNTPRKGGGGVSDRKGGGGVSDRKGGGDEGGVGACTGIDKRSSRSAIQDCQRFLGTPADGIWGANTEAKYKNRYGHGSIGYGGYVPTKATGGGGTTAKPVVIGYKATCVVKYRFINDNRWFEEGSKSVSTGLTNVERATSEMNAQCKNFSNTIEAWDNFKESGNSLHVHRYSISNIKPSYGITGRF